MNTIDPEVGMSDAFRVARAFAASRFEDWSDEQATLTQARAGGEPGKPPVAFEFGWSMAGSGLTSSYCHLTLRGDPLRPEFFSASVRPEHSLAEVKIPALACLLVVEAAWRHYGLGVPALLERVSFFLSLAQATNHGPAWHFARRAWPGAASLLTSCQVDAATGRLTWPDELTEVPEVVQAAGKATAWEPQRLPTPAPPEPVDVSRDREQVLAAAAGFLGTDADLLQDARLRWVSGAGGYPAALPTRERNDPAGGPARSVSLRVQSGHPYYVSQARTEDVRGLAVRVIETSTYVDEHLLVVEYLRTHTWPEANSLVAEHQPPDPGLAPASYYRAHKTTGSMRTGTWALVEVRRTTVDGQPACYVSRYEARVAAERRVEEMRVDLLDAVETLRKRVEAKRGAIFLLDYGVPTLSHPEARHENPAWEVRYYVGPGGPEPIIRWAAVDATDGSVIYLNREKPVCCFPAP